MIQNENIIRKLLPALLLLILVGCKRDVLEIDRPNPNGAIEFSLKTEGAEVELDNAQTKGTPQATLVPYDSVNVVVYSHTSKYAATAGNDVAPHRQLTLKPDASDWTYTPPLFWPVGKKLSFVAYCSDIPFDKAGISFSFEAKVPKKITYKVSPDVTKQPDLLVSTEFDRDKTGNISLTMKHALACVSFCGVATDDKTFVKSIALRNVCSEGTFALDDPDIEWKVNPDSKGVVVFNPGVKDKEELGEDPQDNNYLMTEDGYLMMVPQKLTNAAIDVLYWNGQDDTENKTMTYTLPVDKESYNTWRPGQKYIYKFGNQFEKDITVVYYEKYAGGTYGLYYYEDGTEQYTIEEDKEIVEAGYGVLCKTKISSNVGGIRLSSPSAAAVTSGEVVELAHINSFLYPVDQSGSSTFALPMSSTPVDVYFNNSNKSCGMIVPHFAKGVYIMKTDMKEHDIRTPQQMRNITSLPVSATRNLHTYTQERHLDFSKANIGGVTLAASVVNRNFNDLFEGHYKKIENVDINTSSVNGGLFERNSGEINGVMLLNSSISATGNTGGIAAVNEAGGVITHSRIMGEAGKQFTISGMGGYTGGIAGCNFGKIVGNTALEEATELPVAEVSGWVSIAGSTSGTGGITGENQGTITTCLVNGVYVANGTVAEAKITIQGPMYVGGIVGVNRAQVDGNFMIDNGKTVAQPDVAGLVSISGTGNWVGGIAGINRGAKAVLSQVNVRLGRGNANNAITITGMESVGGIVGSNEDNGTLRTDENSFISVRGNVHITGTSMVGGIVGNNQSGNISNCFVYNFYSQKGPLVHYAPKISGDKLVGGIAGYAGAANIRNCAVFSTVSDGNKGPGETATDATLEIKATTESAGGIVGRAFTGLNLIANYVLGNVKIDGQVQFSGGIMGQNESGTTMKSVYVGNSGSEVLGLYDTGAGLFDKISLPVRDERMKTGGGAMTKTSGTPTIIGNQYVGGICGVNWGVIDGVTINDNVNVGTETGTFVGGIAGGNGIAGTITNCSAYNPKTGGEVVILGKDQVGGIIGLNNGIVDRCNVGLQGPDNSRLITIRGTFKLGGIAGSTGGTATGTPDTRVTNCNVYGKVLVEAIGGANTYDRQKIGGIIGSNEPTSRVVDCNVIGYKSEGQTVDGYDVRIKGWGSVGGIAGSNFGHINGTSTSSYCTVTNTAVVASDGYAGGLVGTLSTDGTAAEQASLYYCDVSYGVLIHYYLVTAGAFVGEMVGTGSTPDKPITILYGTSLTGRTNRIYTGTTNPVLIGPRNDGIVVLPPPPPLPFDPPVLGNLWAKYLLGNYLHWTEYKN